MCHSVYACGYGLSEGSKMLLALEPMPKPPSISASKPASLENPMPGLGLQLWLMDVHFLAMAADDAGTSTVTLEPRHGFEWLIFDLEALAVSPHPAGSLAFRFIDAHGHVMLPAFTRAVRSSWENGRAPVPQYRSPRKPPRPELPVPANELRLYRAQ